MARGEHAAGDTVSGVAGEEEEARRGIYARGYGRR